MKYLSAFVALAAALTGIIGDTHNEAQGITALGWGAIVFAFLSCGAIVYQTRRDRRALAWQERQKVAIRQVANRQIVDAVEHLLVPFYVILHEIWNKDSRSGLVDLARTNDEQYLLEALSRSEIRAEFASMNLRESPDVYPPSIWWQYFGEHASGGSRLLNDVAAKYGAYLDSRTLIALEALRGDEMVGLRLPRLHDIVMANERLPKLTLAHAFSGMGDYAAFDAMLTRVRVLLARATAEPLIMGRGYWSHWSVGRG
jgi:hypothetical protein